MLQRDSRISLRSSGLQDSLEPPSQRQSHRQRFRGMNVAISDAADRLTRQPRQIVIFDLVGFRVEEVEHVELQPQTIVEFVARPRIEDQRRLRTDTVVLDQRTWPEIAPTQRA